MPRLQLMLVTFLKRGLTVGVATALVASTALAQNPVPVVTPASPTAAQAAAAAMGRPVSNEAIADAIKRSGLSEEQLRQRLKAAGYDTTLADPFFGQGKGGATPGATNDFARALSQLGLLSAESTDKKADSVRALPRRPVARVTNVFGKDIFDRATTAFDPVTSGPVDPAYRLGIGDALQLIVTGQVELAYQLDIRRDGTVVIPQVGQFAVAGLTLDAARTLLKSRMGRSYSGLTNGEARLDLSVARLRTNAVFVIGEVEQPGALQVNALATVFHAIARAGGPTERGSFRDIEVRRGNKVIERLDLYDYLLKGDAAGDIRLEQGDVVFVPLARRTVAVTGAVRRPRIFELRESEGFSDLLRFAGGLLPTASVDRVQIDRILPAEKRAPGVERVKVDVELKGKLDTLAKVKLLDGDVVQLFNVGDVRRDVVAVDGEVFQPGEYELKPGATLGSLLNEAQGLKPWSLPTVVKVLRQLPATGRSQLYSQDVTQPEGRGFPLQEYDSVTVLDARTAYPADSIQVSGAVVYPSIRPFVEHETLRDAIERSGGFAEEAQTIEVARRRVGANYSDTTSTVFNFDVTPGIWSDPRVATFELARDDRVNVRRSPGFRTQRSVTVSGEFQRTGKFAITENRDRIRDVVLRAGDVLPGAYAQSFRLYRATRTGVIDSTKAAKGETEARSAGADMPVSVDFAKAMRGDPDQNLPLLDGDSLVIRRDPQTVLVRGAVNRTALIRYSPNLSVSDYVAMAGGPTEKGDRNKAIVEYPSGYSRRVERVAFFFHSSPPVVSGAIITVPDRPEDKGVFTQNLTQTLSVVSTLMSLIIAYATVRKL